MSTATSSVLGYLQEARWSSVALTEDPTCPERSTRDTVASRDGKSVCCRDWLWNDPR